MTEDGRVHLPKNRRIVARRVRTFVGGGLSLRQTDPTHLRSIGQRLERLGSFIEVAKTHRRDTGVSR